MATVFEEPRSQLLALPAFVGGICLLADASVLLRGIPPDTSTRVATAVFALVALASGAWFLAWRRIRLATLTVDDAGIVMRPRGSGNELRQIVRRPDSRLRVEIRSSGSASPTSGSWYVLYDEAVGKPHIAIDAYGVERVKAACRRHGWTFAEPHRG